MKAVGRWWKRFLISISNASVVSNDNKQTKVVNPLAKQPSTDHHHHQYVW